jgi:hypothetical protein
MNTRARRVFALSIVPVSILMVLAGLWWRLPCPVELKVMGMEPSGVADDAGTEGWFVAVCITNRGATALYFADEWVTVEVRVASRWVEAKNRCDVGYLRPHQKREVVLGLPSGADACRLRLKYVREPLKLRFMRACGQLGVWRYAWCRAVAARVIPVGWREPLRSDIVGRSPRWREMKPEVLLPRPSAGTNQVSALTGGFGASKPHVLA